MRWAEGFIAVDWGTTNRRAYRIDEQGNCTGEFEDGLGATSVPKGHYPAAVQEIRDRLGDHPLLLGGMAGSTRGWVDAPYLPCPLDFAALAERLVWPEPGRAAIVPGASYVDDDHADIMRGEEVQILGAVASGEIPADCLVCHPGTHNKWVTVSDGKIHSFKTVMTGEMFGLLKKGSILSEHLVHPVTPGEAFQAGIDRGLGDEALTAEIFWVRARTLLGKLRAEDAASFTSGLLIGRDVRSGLQGDSGREVIVMGRPALTNLYAEAIRSEGHTVREVDGEHAFVAGALKIAEMIQ